MDDFDVVQMGEASKNVLVVTTQNRPVYPLVRRS